MSSHSRKNDGNSTTIVVDRQFLKDIESKFGISSPDYGDVADTTATATAAAAATSAIKKVADTSTSASSKYVSIKSKEECNLQFTKLFNAGFNFTKSKQYDSATKALIGAITLGTQFDECVPQEILNYAATILEQIQFRKLEQGAGAAALGDENDVKKSEVSKKEPLDESQIRKAKSLEELQGIEDIMEKLNETIILPFKFPNLFDKQQTFLMYGPPGTGKTMVAKGLTKTLRQLLLNGNVENDAITIYSATGGTLKSKFVGGTQKNIRGYYTDSQARAMEQVAKGNESALSILFVDEIDSVASSRGAANSTPQDAASVTEFLSVLDGVEGFDRVYTVGATNKPWELDSAILSRFGVTIFSDVPTTDARMRDIMTKICEKISVKGEQCLINNDVGDNIDKNREVAAMKKRFIEFVKLVTSLTGMNTKAPQLLASYFKGIDSDIPEVSCDADSDSDVVKMIRKLTNQDQEKAASMIEACSDEDSMKWTYWLASRKHKVTKEGYAEFGYTFRDIKSIMNQWLNRMATLKLQKNTSEWSNRDVYRISKKGNKILWKEKKCYVNACPPYQVTAEDVDNWTQYQKKKTANSKSRSYTNLGTNAYIKAKNNIQTYNNRVAEIQRILPELIKKELDARTQEAIYKQQQMATLQPADESMNTEDIAKKIREQEKLATDARSKISELQSEISEIPCLSGDTHCRLDPEQSKSIRLYDEDLFGSQEKYNESLIEFKKILKNAKSSARPSEYVEYVYYFLTDKDPTAKKVTSNDAEATVAPQ